MALLFTILCGTAIAILAYFTFYFARGHFIESTSSIIDTEIKYFPLVRDTIGTEQEENHFIRLAFPEDGSLPEELPESVSTLSEGIIVFQHQQNLKTYAAKIHSFDNGQKILFGVDITDMKSDFNKMAWMSVFSIVLIILVILFSYLISIFVVSGTNQIASTAQEIMDTGDLTRRLQVSSRWDDLGNMTVVLNRMLDRIQELMEGIKQVSDNIAHDLRTPLTRMRNKIESLDQSEDLDLQPILSEADRLLSTFNALLSISRIETGKQISQFKDLELDQLLQDVIAFYEPLAEEKSISIMTDIEPAQLNGDRHLLFQAFANLLDNAIKFTPDNGNIKISLHKISNSKSRITIHDTGPGIPENELDKVFQRFYRCDNSRSTTGTGLGLSLVFAVIQLHKGTINIENSDSGLSIITDL